VWKKRVDFNAVDVRAVVHLLLHKTYAIDHNIRTNVSDDFGQRFVIANVH